MHACSTSYIVLSYLFIYILQIYCTSLVNYNIEISDLGSRALTLTVSDLLSRCLGVELALNGSDNRRISQKHLMGIRT